jgi:hypothetical protein
MSRARCCVAFAGCLLGACDDRELHAFEPHGSALGGGAFEPGAGSQAGGGRGGTTSIEPVAGAGNAPPSSPLLVDDFEDGDPRAKEPLGWWYPVNDRTGTQGFGIEPASSSAASVYALRTHGSGFQSWGAALGVNLVDGATPLNLLSYEELCFVARVEADTAQRIEVHLLRQGEEEEHYRKEVSLSESWTRYCLPLVAFIGANEAALLPNELIALQFFFPPGSPFALWLDDVSVVP